MINRILMIDVDLDSSSMKSRPYSHHPLGLMYLSAFCKNVFRDIECRIFHTSTSSDPRSDLKALTSDFHPDLIGFRSLSIAQGMFKDITRYVRRMDPRVLLVAGGPYPSTSYDELLNQKLVDVVVMGEGERTFTDIVGALRDKGEIPRDLCGTAVKNGGHIRVNPPAEPIQDLDALPFPDYSIIDLKAYDGLVNQALEDTSQCAFIFCSRGCPYRCFYCHRLFAKKLRRRSAENILSEMQERVEKHGVNRFVIVDDLFNVPMRAAKEILTLIAKRLPGIRLSFPNGLRSDHIDEELLDLFEEAGTTMMAFAVETASKRLQKKIGKNLDLTKAKAAIHSASKRFIVRTFYMIGFPTETEEEAIETIRFASDLDHVCSPFLSVVRLFKGTTLFDDLQPTEEQISKLDRQEQMDYVPRLYEEPVYYGDLFPRDKVPLTGVDIRRLRWKWLVAVFNNKTRVANGHRVLQKHLDSDRVIDFYRVMYENPEFNEQALQRLLK